MLIDKSTYDLMTPEGQLQALSDIIDEFNGQDSSVHASKALKIIATGVANVTLASPPWTGPPIAFYQHNLGYAPMFFAFQGQVNNGGVNLLPLVDFQTQPSTALGGVVQAYADSTSLYVYWQDHAQAQVQQITYFVFNQPIVEA